MRQHAEAVAAFGDTTAVKVRSNGMVVVVEK